jgi:hypothetical protein
VIVGTEVATRQRREEGAGEEGAGEDGPDATQPAAAGSTCCRALRPAAAHILHRPAR